jgi:hypothetical protein
MVAETPIAPPSEDDTYDVPPEAQPDPSDDEAPDTDDEADDDDAESEEDDEG